MIDKPNRNSQVFPVRVWGRHPGAWCALTECRFAPGAAGLLLGGRELPGRWPHVLTDHLACQAAGLPGFAVLPCVAGLLGCRVCCRFAVGRVCCRFAAGLGCRFAGSTERKEVSLRKDRSAHSKIFTEIARCAGTAHPVSRHASPTLTRPWPSTQASVGW